MRALLEAAGLEVVAIDSVPFAHYVSPAPLRAAVAVREIVRAGTALPPWRHSSGHQLLRGVARRP
ncbi:MAG TPA: hypothetical protein VIZ61_14880 [Solirubrobacterales bacterium]